METKSALKTVVLFLAVYCLSLVIYRFASHRVMNSGGCGPRALHAVSVKLGGALSEEETLNLFPHHGYDVTIDMLENRAPRLKLKAVVRQMNVEELKKESPLGVLHVDNSHFVAIVGYEGDSVLIVDSIFQGENESVRWMFDDLKSRWDGAILVVSSEP